jgi:hypothetical protein
MFFSMLIRNSPFPDFELSFPGIIKYKVKAISLKEG